MKTNFINTFLLWCLNDFMTNVKLSIKMKKMICWWDDKNWEWKWGNIVKETSNWYQQKATKWSSNQWEYPSPRGGPQNDVTKCKEVFLTWSLQFFYISYLILCNNSPTEKVQVHDLNIWKFSFTFKLLNYSTSYFGFFSSQIIFQVIILYLFFHTFHKVINDCMQTLKTAII